MSFKFSKEQFDGLEHRVSGHWDAETAAEIYRLYEPYFNKIETDVDQITAFCRTVRNYATAYRIDERRDVFKLIIVALALGAHFCHDPRYRLMLQETVMRSGLPSGRRLHLLSIDVDLLLRARKKVGVFSNFGTYLSTTLPTHTTNAQDDTITLLLGQLRLGDGVSNIDLTSFVGFCLPHCDGYGLRNFEQRFVYCACALVHGVYWFDDPVMSSLRNHLLSASSRSNLVETLEAFYRRFD